jgi:hypothetical protein
MCHSWLDMDGERRLAARPARWFVAWTWRLHRRLDGLTADTSGSTGKPSSDRRRIITRSNGSNRSALAGRCRHLEN